MKVAVIGAGFTGLAAAYRLVKSGAEVDVFEWSTTVGGLASGFRDRSWQWPLEAHYHHLFTSDHAILDLAAEIDVPVGFYQPMTSTYSHGSVFRLDSPVSLMKFPYLSPVDRVRTGLGIAMMKYNPLWQPFEYFTAQDYILRTMGRSSWREIWEPLFAGKFGSYADRISAAWFWARIYKRSSSLGYPGGGFQALAAKLALQISAKGGRFMYGKAVDRIRDSHTLIVSGKEYSGYNAVLCTLPSRLFARITDGLPSDYVESLGKFTGLGAVNLILAVKKQFLTDGTYWLNINDRSFPFLAVVEHTNMVDPEHYSGDRLLYVGNYLPPDHRYFGFTPRRLLKEFMPYLQKINPGFSPDWVSQVYSQTAAFAQPVVTCNYSRLLPPINTPLKGVYLANMQQVYPWDRGTNYAVKIGYDAVQKILAQAGSGT